MAFTVRERLTELTVGRVPMRVAIGFSCEAGLARSWPRRRTVQGLRAFPCLAT
jgi:hypothetical protein